MSRHAVLESFVASLPDRIKQDSSVWPAQPGSGESGHDRIARAILAWLPAELKVTLHAEGLLHNDPPIKVIPRKYKGEFAGSWNSPDIALIHDDLRIAIEVDRGRGRVGASARTAMTKGCFAVLTGDFHRCVVLIFQADGCEVVLNESDRRVIDRFLQDFKTEVHFFTRRPGVQMRES